MSSGIELLGFDPATNERVSEPAASLISRVPIEVDGTLRILSDVLEEILASLAVAGAVPIEQTYSLAQGNITAGQASISLPYTPGFVRLFYSTPGGAALDITPSCTATNGTSITLPSGGFPGGSVVLTVRAETVAQGLNTTPAVLSVGDVTQSVADHLAARPRTADVTPAQVTVEDVTASVPVHISNRAPLAHKRPFAAARSRSQAERLNAAALNVLDYIAPSLLDGATNVSTQIAACVADARSAGIRRVVVPSTPAPLVLNGPTIDISGITLEAEGGGYGPTARIATNANATMFAASGNNATLRGLFLEHHGANGRIFSAIDGSEGHNIQDCSLVADGAGASDPMVVFTGSNSYLRDSQITNFCPNRYAVLFQRIPNVGDSVKININSGVDRCYFGGPGKGIGIGSIGGAPRPEGVVISGCNSVLTGGPLIEVSDVQSLRIINNLIDQGSEQGAIRLTPRDTGILGVQIIGNYISSVRGGNSPAAVSILHDDSGGAGLVGLLISGNEICYSRGSIQIGNNAAKISVTGNWIHDIGNTFACSQKADGQVYFDASNMLGSGVVGLTTVAGLTNAPRRVSSGGPMTLPPAASLVEALTPEVLETVLTPEVLASVLTPAVLSQLLTPAVTNAVLTAFWNSLSALPANESLIPFGGGWYINGSTIVRILPSS